MITALASIIYLSSAQVFAVTIEDQQKFSAQLSGDQEVPPIQTNASGMAWFKTNQDSMEFELNVTRLQGTTMAHLQNYNGSSTYWKTRRNWTSGNTIV